MATGFQVVVLLINSDKVHASRLTQDCQTEASVLVEEFGLYLIAIFPTIRKTGIVNLPVEYTKLINVTSSRESPNMTNYTNANTYHDISLPTKAIGMCVVKCSYVSHGGDSFLKMLRILSSEVEEELM